MKNYLKLILTVLTALMLALSVIACSHEDEGESGTLEMPTHLSGESDSESDSESETSSESVTQTESESESETETEARPVVQSLEYLSFGNGTCAVVGIGDVTDLYIVIPEKSPDGDVVVSVGAGAFYQATDITVVQIPSTVYEIGARAFSDCNALVHIAVDDNNPYFCDRDGVLFDKKLTSLICYPAAKASSSLLIPGTVTKIYDMALYGCDNLKLIHFDGTVQAWEKVDIGDKNYGLYTASLAFKQ